MNISPSNILNDTLLLKRYVIKVVGPCLGATIMIILKQCND